MTAYRTAPLTPPAAPPWWQRVAAKVAPGLSGAGGWQWYRAAKGGRWSLACRYDAPSYRWTWSHQREDGCPATWRRFTPEELATMPLMTVAAALAQNATIASHAAGCTCEVYP